MKLFGHEFGKHEEPKAANPAEVAAAEAAAAAPTIEAPAETMEAVPTATTEALGTAAVVSNEAFNIPTTEVSEEAVTDALGTDAALLDTTEAEANGTMDEVSAAPASEDKYANMQPMAAKDAVLEGAMTDAPEMHTEIKEATAAGELDTAPDTLTASDEAIIEGLNLPAVGSEEGEAALIATDTSVPSLGKEVDELNTLEQASVLAPEEHIGVPVTTNEEIVDALHLPEAGSPDATVVLEESSVETPIVGAEAPASAETPEQQQ